VELQTLVLGARHFFVGEQAVALGDLFQHKNPFMDALWEQESSRDVLKVLDKAADDDNFIAVLTHRGSQALETYHLTAEAEAALLGGDLRWIRANIGQPSERQQTWLWCRLGQEIW
jgi:hypothetical protein